jgi:hypothetical protein
LTNITFYFNTTLGTFADSELGCNMNGGHVAAYTSQDEQADVEGYYYRMGFLLPVSCPTGQAPGLRMRMRTLHTAGRTVCHLELQVAKQ